MSKHNPRDDSYSRFQSRHPKRTSDAKHPNKLTIPTRVAKPFEFPAWNDATWYQSIGRAWHGSVSLFCNVKDADGWVDLSAVRVTRLSKNILERCLAAYVLCGNDLDETDIRIILPATVAIIEDVSCRVAECPMKFGNHLGERYITAISMQHCVNLEYVGFGAFADNRLTSISFPKTPKPIHLEDMSFDGNRLLAHVGWGSVASIGGEAFRHTALRYLNFSDTQVVAIESYAFSGSTPLFVHFGGQVALRNGKVPRDVVGVAGKSIIVDSTAFAGRETIVMVEDTNKTPLLFPHLGAHGCTVLKRSTVDDYLQAIYRVFHTASGTMRTTYSDRLLHVFTQSMERAVPDAATRELLDQFWDPQKGPIVAEFVRNEIERVRDAERCATTSLYQHRLQDPSRIIQKMQL